MKTLDLRLQNAHYYFSQFFQQVYTNVNFTFGIEYAQM